MVTLGLDIGSNSVGSSWVDTEKKSIHMMVGIFPSGVDETETKRGSPINQRRREKRSQRRGIGQPARKHALRRFLANEGLLPKDRTDLDVSIAIDPWVLRREGLNRELEPFEFGRVLMHLNQRRGALGVQTDPEDDEEGKVKEAIDHLRRQLNGRTFGHFIADLMESRRRPVQGKEGKFFCDAVRNRRDRFEFHADRNLIREEFLKLWEHQKSYKGPLAKLLTPKLREELDDATEDDTWRHHSAIFGQRRTYWDTGTLGRCDLEPTEHRCPIGDMFAQEFRVLETVNNLKIEERGKPARPLKPEGANVFAALRAKDRISSNNPQGAGHRSKSNQGILYSQYQRNEQREINTDWFYREIIRGAFGEDQFEAARFGNENGDKQGTSAFGP